MGDLLSALLAQLLASVLLSALGRPPLRLDPPLIWMGLWLLWRAYQGFYPGYGRSPQTELRLHTLGTCQVALAQLAAAFAVHQLVPSVGGVLLMWFLLVVFALLTRYTVRAVLITWGQYGRDISVIGAGRTAALTIAHLRANPAYGLRPVATYDDNPRLHGSSVQGVPVVGAIELALRCPLTEQALISIPGARAETQSRLVNSVYAVFPITWIIPDLFGVPNQALKTHNIGSLATLEIRNNLRSRRSQIVKRLLDIVLSLIGLVLASPLFLLIIIIIYINSPGPVIYRSSRIGRNFQLFDCYKFRSMYHESDLMLEKILDEDYAMRKEYETFHKLRRDPRITSVGGVLRRFSLDELPQIFNVLKGNMSLVGPRPYLPSEKDKMGEIAHFIAQVSPGMTGYWQVVGRNHTTFDERLEMDRFYIANWTPWLDLVLLIQTVRVVIVGKGAY
ncbi:undecaprenyl-phosphate galactose phosphotransferase WbaP [Deinococcus aerophilus]|uniref:undecaprenyl-phosphate galactose phosphotransferase WbaP n=1 Tax=Deinococcus aerophilus TaxID=522488 RepID=UPI001E2DF1A3|nr:undecaprenyl-phosphate galactose phosphotransferase WbaP [Deinococcus aerophilus]